MNISEERPRNPHLGHRDWLVLKELKQAKEPVAAYTIWKKIHVDAPSCVSMKPQQANNAFGVLKRYGFARETAPPPDNKKWKGQVAHVLAEEKVDELADLAKKWADELGSAEKWSDNDLARFCEAADVIDHFLGRKVIQRMVRLRQTALENVKVPDAPTTAGPWLRRAREALRRLAALEGELLDGWQAELYESDGGDS